MQQHLGRLANEVRGDHRPEHMGSPQATPLCQSLPMPAHLGQGEHVRRVGHPRDDAPGQPPRRHQPGPGFPRLRRRRPRSRRRRVDAIQADINQYAITWGAKAFRDAIAAKTMRCYPGWSVDPEINITVTCGATEGMIAAMMAIIDPGDEVVVFEPFYENYGPDAILSGAIPRYVTLHEPDWRDRPGRAARGLRAPDARHRREHAAQPHRQGVHPRGARADRRAVPASATSSPSPTRSTSTSVYAGEHIPLATMPGMAERTVTINALSKTYSVTGWRVGWVIASPELTNGIRKVHDFLTVGAAAPLQAAGVVALGAARQLLRRARRRNTASGATCSCRRSSRRLPGIARRRLLRDGRHRGLTDEDDVTFCAPAGRDRRAWRRCRAPPSTRVPSWAETRCDSPFPRLARHSTRQPNGCAS